MNRNRTPLLERFWAKVDAPAPESCWRWTGFLDTDGYGKIWVAERQTMVVAHRVSYELFIGPIPEGLQIDHLCRVRECVNPQHLEPVTTQENTRRGLAGSTSAALNRAKTHCPHGHAYTEANTYHNSKGGRGCRTCRRNYPDPRRSNHSHLVEVAS